jgi:hypothetical protein
MLYFANTFFNNTAIATQGSYTYDSLKTLASTFSVNQQINTNLIFGDFLAALKLIFSIVTGTTIAEAFRGLPYFSDSLQLLTSIVFSISSVFLWVYIVANRSI